MTPAVLAETLRGLAPGAVAVALCASRLLPVAFLCPLLGGQAAPGVVRLGLVLALSVSLSAAGGVTLAVLPSSSLAFAGLALKELVFGTSLGLIAALPFDAARMGGRFADLFRGTSAEAALPHAGTRESATGDGLYQLMSALAVSGVGFPLVLPALWRTFGTVGLGAAVPTGDATHAVVALVGTAMAAGLAVGAPVAGCTLAVDCLLGLASRAAPSLQLQESGAPLRILAGGAVLWLGLGAACTRLLGELERAAAVLDSLAGLVR
ncbi:MAG: flagellar biosynthetic protein FliR [Myxococcaceae bacterium]|nr:flagellar biosynthetic protein FliR [Myxococcaceae bacterium]MCI0671840.1 flagellar biosynthetic protein FliR [Myxococcaceae bacterium]